MNEQQILLQARHVIQHKDRQAGLRLLAQAVHQYPKSETAWLWLSALVDDPQQERYCLYRVLKINPNNKIARKQWLRLQTSAPAPQPPQTQAPIPQPAQRDASAAQPAPLPARDAQVQQPSPVRETVYYNKGDILVTSARAILSGKTVAISSMTSVALAESGSPKPVAAVLMLIGVISSLLAYDSDVCLGFGLLYIVVGIVLLCAEPAYRIRIGSAANETNILSSLKRQEIEEIVAAMNQAIMDRR
ncbi:MAG: hypothetical protein JXM73_21945 [Anaerolineae bacterium]|nr:hypothetical protein [Anaerolineae bacterium]